ncbi:MAG: xanthine dehydrogenase family protein subunit M [Bacillota bacterium]
MLKFDYLRPGSVKEACRLLAQHKEKAKVIAGGTDLMVQLRDEDKKLKDIAYVIDINHLKELKYIKKDGDYLRIGALTTHDEIYKSELINEAVPFLAQAVNTVGSPQIRHRGTIGGSICNASPAADPVPPLVALDAQLKLVSAKGEREVSLLSIFEKPYVTNLAPDELLVEVYFKGLPENTKTSFIKLGRRKALAIARMNIAAAITLDSEGKVVEARIAPGSVLPKPDRVRTAEELLLGKAPDQKLLEEAGRKVSEEMIKRSGIRWSTEYKKPVIEALTQRVINQALGVE